ncbi:hypothetical protein JCM14036_27970 [Desulfotomaculum defluvii]
MSDRKYDVKKPDFFDHEDFFEDRKTFPPVDGCPQLPGTLIRINIPAGAVINLLNLIEVASPSGICLIVRLPILGKHKNNSLKDMFDAIRSAGGSVEFVK